MFQSFIIAFSMYSKLPMPRIEWNQKNMRYALCFFPAVGLVIGALSLGILFLCRQLGMGDFFTAAAAVILPVLITGGIHLDGYLDTVDALSSDGDMEKRLSILKDPNSGAFAIIYGLVYFLAAAAVWMEMDARGWLLVSVIYVMSRTFSALSVVSFPLAKNTGLAATFQDQAQKKHVKVCMCVLLVLETAVLLWLHLIAGTVVILLGILCYGIHYHLCRTRFGGITGDLAGFFLQIFELVTMSGVMAVFRILG